MEGWRHLDSFTCLDMKFTSKAGFTLFLQLGTSILYCERRRQGQTCLINLIPSDDCEQEEEETEEVEDLEEEEEVAEVIEVEEVVFLSLEGEVEDEVAPEEVEAEAEVE